MSHTQGDTKNKWDYCEVKLITICSVMISCEEWTQSSNSWPLGFGCWVNFRWLS